MKVINKDAWGTKFAFFPVTTITGKRAWLKKVFSRRLLLMSNGQIEVAHQYATTFELLSQDPDDIDRTHMYRDI